MIQRSSLTESSRTVLRSSRVAPRSPSQRCAGSGSSCESVRTGSTKSASLARAPSESRSTRAKVRAQAASEGVFSAASASGSHSAPRSEGGCPRRSSSAAHRFALGHPPLRVPQPQHQPQDRAPLGQRQSARREQSAQQVQRRRQRPGAKAHAPVRAQREALAAHRVRAVAPDEARDAQALAVGAHQQVLAVVEFDGGSRHAQARRARPPAQRRRGLEEDRTVSGQQRARCRRRCPPSRRRSPRSRGVRTRLRCALRMPTGAAARRASRCARRSRACAPA